MNPSQRMTAHETRSISMVHARAFSFTDDSSSVEYPTASPTFPPMDHMDSIVGPHSMDAAHLLWQLRRAQSSWYQELFQSSREPLPQGSTYLWKMCQEMREWSDSFPDSLPLAFKDFFDLELLYSYIYCLAPSCRVHTVTDYAKNLIFEHAITYMQRIFPISQDPINKAFYTYHDALRVYFIGSQLMAVLSDSQDQIFNGSYSVSGMGSSPPPLPTVTGSSQVDRSLNCIKHIKETLRTFGQRWEDSKALLSSFDVQAEPIISSLHRRKQQQQQYIKEESPIGHSPNFMPPPGYDHRAYQMKQEWTGMNPMYPSSDVSGFGGPSHGTGL